MKKYLGFLLVVFLLFQPVKAQNVKLLEELQNHFNSIKDFSADLVQLNNGKVNLEGKLFFKKENDLRLELKNLIIVSDGKTNWNYNKRLKKVIISDYDENDPSVLSLKRIIFDYPAKCEVSETTEKGENVLVLKPKPDSGINADLIKIWINKESNVSRVSASEASGNNIEVRFSNYKINAGIPDSKFSFTPPQGTKVIDLR
jgi:outer membrane lipoprotein carrier protein